MQGKALRLFVFVTVAGLMTGLPRPILVVAAESPFVGQAEFKPEGEIDKLVLAKLERLKVQPAQICSDAVFRPASLLGRHRHASHPEGSQRFPAEPRAQASAPRSLTVCWRARNLRIIGR